MTEVVGKNVAAVLYSTGIKEMWQVLEPYVRGERQLRSAKGLGGFWGSFEYLADAYQAACSATDHAVTGLDAVAVTINAPTRVLAAARAAISPPPDTGERLTATAPGQPGQRLPASTPQRPDWPGSVEQAVRNIGSPDLILLMRARAIDKLANKLIAEAKQPSKDVDRASRADARGPSAAIARNPVRVAGENFPLNPRATSAASRPVSMPPRSAARLRTKGC